MRNRASGNEEGWIASSRSLSSGRPKAGPVGPRNDSKRDILSPQPRRQPLTDLAACDLAGPNQLLLPDRSGNNRIDSLRNIVEGSGFVQLIFFVPGIDETLRVGGKGKLSAEPKLLAAMEEFGKLPRAVLSVGVHEAYFHCGKALMRSKLWPPDTRGDRAGLPSISQVIHDQTQLGDPETQAEVEARYKTQL